MAPILRFADIEGYVQESTTPGRLDGLIQVGVTQEDQPHYLRVLARPETDPSDLIGFALGAIAAGAARAGSRRPNHGVIAPVRTYESPLDRRFEEAGFGEIAMVTLLLKETLARVADPALVPAVARPWEVTRGS
jgi:hypothetical protein